ncbi:phage holin family protein [Marinactinospora thermotolerans]|uniref:Putative Holin-X, holin superfamily III n=1 Tax=Marinactinospora thermotolerans DSM 45154 TaxID=1122192 RepID=A0A1T4T205_9ACTN|nr:phage holin family protein [Marinactinospora thermotolerans]SKA34524.1 Putative Holin-X, holin superfamily III [Marinactinospora thermotolerans DSM 45154]
MPETQTGGQEPGDLDAAERSLGELVSDAGDNISRLVRLELELAKLEIASDARKVAKSSGLFVVAAVLGHLVLILVSITIALGLAALGLQPWLAFLIVTVFYLLVAGVLAFVGVRYLRRLQGTPRTSATMTRTMAVLRRDPSAGR